MSTVLSRFLPPCVLPALYGSVFYELDADDILAFEPRAVMSFRLRGERVRNSMGGGHAGMRTATQRCCPFFLEWYAFQRSTRT